MARLRIAVICLIAGLLISYAVICYPLRWQLAHGYSDFVSFYTAGKILQRGQAGRLYDLELQHQIQQGISGELTTRKGALPFVRPAFEAWIFFPLAFLPYTEAFFTWNLFNLSCLILIARVLHNRIRGLSGFSFFLLTAGILSYFPVFLTFLLGQDSILLLLIYLAAYELLRMRKELSSGLVLGLAWIKFPLLIPFLIPLLVRKHFRLISGVALTSLTLCIISVATAGRSAFLSYPRFLLNVDRLAPGVNVPRDMPNLRGLVSLLPMLSTHPHVQAIIVALISAVLIAVVAAKCHFNVQNSGTLLALEYSFNMVTTLLVSYHCHVFDLCLLLLPVAVVVGLLCRDEYIGRTTRTMLAWTTGAVVFSPIYLVLTFVAKYPCVLSSVALVFALALGFGTSAANRACLQKPNPVPVAH